MINIGTRGSKLALWQANNVAERLNQAGIETTIVVIETKGDQLLSIPFSKIGSKGLFTEEIENQLLNGTIDIAVHSAKDVQSHLPEGLEIIAFCEREKPNDVLVSFDKNYSISKNGKKTIGTSSTRRRAILQHYYPDAEMREARGNLQTRFQKMEEKQFEAMILAYAGVHRMNLDSYIVEELPLDVFTPPVGQGSVAVEISSHLNDQKKETIRKAVNHPETEVALKCERAYLRRLEGGCSIPSFGIAGVSGNSLSMHAGIISLDGSELIRKQLSGSIEYPEELGLELAEIVLASGGDKILEEIKRSR